MNFDISVLGETLYGLFYYAVILLAAILLIVVLGIGFYYFIQATRYDVEVYIKRKGLLGYKKDKLRYLKTDDGEIGYLRKAKAFIHPLKVKPFIKFVEGKKKPVLYLYTEDMKDFYPIEQENYEVVKEIEIGEGKNKNKIKVKVANVDNVVRVDDSMVRLHAYEELKRSMERSKIENPLKRLIEVGKYFAVGLFMLLGVMIITNSIKDFSEKTVEINKENIKFMKELLNKNQIIYNTTQLILDQQAEYVRELRRMTDSISLLVQQVRDEQKLFRDWLERQSREEKEKVVVYATNTTR